MLTNLLDNAIRHSPTGGTVDVPNDRRLMAPPWSRVSGDGEVSPVLRENLFTRASVWRADRGTRPAAWACLPCTGFWRCTIATLRLVAHAGRGAVFGNFRLPARAVLSTIQDA